MSHLKDLCRVMVSTRTASCMKMAPFVGAAAIETAET
jgi:hypothetical protein